MGRCEYIFRRGPYTGEKCLRCCEGDLCVDHYGKDIPVDIKIPDKSATIDLFEIRLQIKKLEDECSRCLRLYHGYCVRINSDHKIPVRKKILREMKSKEFIKDCREEYDELDPKTRKRYGYFKGYLKQSREKYLSYPNTYINIIPFNGSIDEAEKRLYAVSIKYENYRQQIIKLKKYMASCELETEPKRESPSEESDHDSHKSHNSKKKNKIPIEERIDSH